MNADALNQLLPGSLTAMLPALARIGGIVAVAPPFAGAAVPRRVRGMLAIALTIGLTPAIGVATLPSTIGGSILAIAGEAMIGVAIGLAMSLLFVAAQWAGSMIAMQLGLNLAETFDPNSPGESSPLGHAYWLLTVVIFMSVNGHHALVRGIQSSFSTMPAMKIAGGAGLLDMLIGMTSSATSIALRLAVPVFVTMFVVDLALGMVGRTVPQVGLMTAGVAVRSIAGLIVVVLSMALAAMVLSGASAGWFSAVQTALTGR